MMNWNSPLGVALGLVGILIFIVILFRYILPIIAGH